MKNAFLIFAGIAWLAGAQTRIDFASQGRNADFTSFVSTRPVRTGTVLPGTCGVAELFFKINAPAGSNLYACTSSNTWTLWLANALPATANQQGKVLTTDGTAAAWSLPAGDVAGSIEALSVTGLQNRPVAASAPLAGQVLGWNGTANRWEPTLLGGDVSGTAGSVSVTGLQNRRIATTAPAGGQVLTWNHLTSKWEPAFMSPVPIQTADAGKALSTNGIATVWTSLGGDVSGSLGALSVIALQNRPVASAAPADKQVLTWSQANTRWEPKHPDAGVATGAGILANSSSGTTVLSIDASAVPSWYAQAGTPQGACVTGRDFSTDTVSGALYNCQGGNWRVVDAPLPSTSQTIDLRPGGCAADGAKALNHLWSMPSSAASPAGVGLTCNAGSVSTPDNGRLSFVWAAAAPSRAFASILLPENWDGRTDFHMDVYTEAGTGTIAFEIDKACVGDGDPDGASQPTFRDKQVVTFTGPTARTLTRISVTPLGLVDTQASPNSCMAGKTMVLRITRDAGAGDSFAGPVYSSHAHAVVRGE